MAARDIAVVVATYRRQCFLRDLVTALEAQTLDRDRFEVVVVDDASNDGTFELLDELAGATALDLRAIRLERNAGPGPARHVGVEATTASILAFTDDDCIPEPGWLAGLLGAFRQDPGLEVVQGRTTEHPTDPALRGPWDRTIRVTGPTPWFETCNIAYRRAAYERAGGFDHEDPLVNPGGGTHFGEDAVLGARVLAHGGRRGFAADASVHHRVLPGTFREHLAAQQRLALFPALASRSAIVSDALWHGVFLSSRTATFDLAAAGVAAALLTRRWVPALTVAPWAVDRWREAELRSGGDRARSVPILLRLAIADVASAGALIRGSVRERRVLL